MAWTKVKYGTPVMYQAPRTWSEPQRVTVETGSSSEYVSIVKVKSPDILAKQLDPKVVTLKALIESGITIDPGQCASMLNITDVAEIEKYNQKDMQEVYTYLKEHGKEIVKQEELKTE